MTAPSHDASLQTLGERIEHSQSSAGAGAIRFVVDDTSELVPWGQLLDEAAGVAARLQSHGVGPGSHVALLGPTSRALVTAIEATWLAGATLVMLPLPMRLSSIEAFVAQTRARVASADVDVLVVDPELAPFLAPQAGDPPIVMLDALTAGGVAAGAAAFERPKPDADAVALLQFTSGSTSDPKGVVLPHRHICNNHDGIVEAATLDPGGDRFVSWLPLYHDMGLIGLLGLPMTRAVDLVLAPPQTFLAQPARWMHWMSEFAGTVSAGPNFSYALATRALRRQAPKTLDLSRWRIALNGAEPVHADAVDAFIEAAEQQGFDPRATFPVFGMAEATLAVTFPAPMTGLRVDAVDRRVLQHEGLAVAGDYRLARLGGAIPGLEIRITNPATGDTVPDREAGELEIRGNSVTPGYYGRPDLDGATFHDGWLRTGDLAYIADGDLVVCGRLKDMIIVGGRNVFPEDVERAVAAVEGVRAGNVIAFGVPKASGREGVVVVAEARDAGVRAEVADRVRDAVGLPPEVVLVEPGTLPKTSSGKLQRSLCRSRYLEAELSLL